MLCKSADKLQVFNELQTTREGLMPHKHWQQENIGFQKKYFLCVYVT